MLKDYIEARGESVYKIALDCNLPYTTLNELVLEKKSPEKCRAEMYQRLAMYWQMSLEEVYAAAGMEVPVSLPKPWAEEKKKVYRFPVAVQSPFEKIWRVHPLKQKEISAAWKVLQSKDQVEKGILFGSAITICCSRNSDIDLALQLKAESNCRKTKNDVSEAIGECCGYNMDILWMDSVKAGSAVMSNIQRGLRLK